MERIGESGDTQGGNYTHQHGRNMEGPTPSMRRDEAVMRQNQPFGGVPRAAYGHVPGASPYGTIRIGSALGNATETPSMAAARSSTFSVRSGCTENDEFFNPTPSEAARLGKKQEGGNAASPPGNQASGSGTAPSTDAKDRILQEMMQRMAFLESQVQNQQKTIEKLTAMNHIRTPSTKESTSSLIINPFGGAEDDVFTTSPAPNNTLVKMHLTELKTKNLEQLLTSCFGKIEAAVRHMTVVNLNYMYKRLPNAHRQIVKLGEDLLNNHNMARTMLSDKYERPCVLSGVICNEIKKRVFEDSILGNFYCDAHNDFMKSWLQEQAHKDKSHPDATNLYLRYGLALNRAQKAAQVIASGGFWDWTNKFVADTTKEIVSMIAAAFLPHQTDALQADLMSAVDEATRIAIRMRQEPLLFDFYLPTHGCGWNSKYHVHRNADLAGEVLADDRSPYVVRCPMLPLVKYKFFGENSSEAIVLHKAEVIVGHRRENQRPNRAH